MSFSSQRGSVRAALVIIVLLTLVALTSQWWLPHDPQAIDLPFRLLSPDGQHWLGTDHLGRDIFSRLLAATRVAGGGDGLFTAGSGAGAPHWRLCRPDGRRVDQLTMRVADMFMTFPTSILSFLWSARWGPG